jgi:hypothetical protein
MISSIALLSAMFIPLAFAAISVLAYLWWIKRDQRRSPLSGKLHHSAGEQLRTRMEEQTDEMVAGWMLMSLSIPCLMLAWALQFVPWQQLEFGSREVLFALAAVVVFSVGLRGFLRHASLRRRAREGLAAERMTAQELDRLATEGCQVLHDIPGESFNLDHVVVGPRGVVVVETKSFKKPPKGQGDSHYKVQYDGKGLLFQGWATTEPITQALGNARWLHDYLRKAINRDVPVIPAVALPGWWIDQTKGAEQSAVRVFAPAGRGAQFMIGPRFGAPLDDATRALVVQALVMRYPDVR